ncbi:MAG: patatin-like phospholipase family protein [Bacteroidetes bacterium]|nr:patatin-like phospholipase family protein [Bacteroidota bacterium]
MPNYTTQDDIWHSIKSYINAFERLFVNLVSTKPDTFNHKMDYNDEFACQTHNYTILPISGAGCFSQIAILARMSELGYSSEVMLGASGGNITAYIANASRFNPIKMIDMAYELHPSMFCRPWTGLSPIVSTYCGLHKGSLYNHGTDNTDYLLKHYQDPIASPEEVIKTNEIWSAAYDIDSQRTRLFCNRSKCEAIIDPAIMDPNIYQIEEPIYADYDVSMLSKIITASASIPLVVPPQVINGNRMQDAGLSCASPMTLMSPLFKDLKEIHLYYINSEDIDVVGTMSTSMTNDASILSNFNQARGAMLKNITANDRRLCYDLVVRQAIRPDMTDTFDFNISGWNKCQSLCSNYKRSLVEICPRTTTPINISSFTRDDVAKEVNNALSNSVIKVWCSDTCGRC